MMYSSLNEWLEINMALSIKAIFIGITLFCSEFFINKKNNEEGTN